MNDYMLRAITKNGMVRIYAALTTQTVEEAKNIHQMNPTPSVALGRTLTAAALMAGTLKNTNSTITIQIKGDGPIGGILAVTDSQSNVRGYVDNPWFDLPINERGKFDIAGAVGKGYLNVITDLGLKDPYIGRVDLVSGEIAEDITFYYATSEQTTHHKASGWQQPGGYFEGSACRQRTCFFGYAACDLSVQLLQTKNGKEPSKHGAERFRGISPGTGRNRTGMPLLRNKISFSKR